MKLPRRVVADASTPPAQGFPRWAWSAVLLAILLFVVPSTSPWWSTILRTEIPESPLDESDGPAAVRGGSPATGPASVPSSTLKVTLHTRLSTEPGLGNVEREIPYARGVAPQIKAVLTELAIPAPEAPALLPEGTAVLDVAFTREGVVYVDFSPELQQGRDVGAEEEKTLVQGIVATITDNFPAVRSVVILVDGKPAPPGHLDLGHPFGRDDPAFAPDPPPEVESGEGEAGAPPAVVPTPSVAPAPAVAVKPAPPRPLPTPR